MPKKMSFILLLAVFLNACIHSSSEEAANSAKPEQLKTPALEAAKVSRTKIDLNELVKKTKEAGKNYLQIPPGSYETDKTALLNNIKDLTIDGTGVNLFMTEIQHVFLIGNSENITLKGFTIDYDPLPFTQGTITAINGRDVEFEIHKAYPDLTEKNLYNGLYVFDKNTRLWKKGVSDVYGKMTIIDPRHGSLKTNVDQPLLAVGDLVCIDPRKRSCIHSYSSKNVSMENLTIYSAPGATIGGRFNGDNHRFKKIRIIRGPRPAGATEDRLLSTNADGINYAMSTSSPVIEDCEFGFMGDDAVNFHGPLFPVVKVESPTSFLTVRVQTIRPYKEVMKPGDTLRHLESGTYAKLGNCKFKSIDEVKNHGIDRQVLRRHLPEYQKNFDTLCTVYRIQVTESVEMKVGQSMDMPAMICSNFVIRNSYFHDNRPRGLRLMASNGIIENNRFERIRESAIDIGNECPHWGEAGWVDNVIIRNNILKDIGTGNVLNKDNRVPGAICIFTMNGKGITKYYPGHANILIENNTLENCAPVGIYIYGAKDVTIKDNTVINSCVAGSEQAGANGKLGPKKAIDIHPDSQAVLINNKILP